MDFFSTTIQDEAVDQNIATALPTVGSFKNEIRQPPPPPPTTIQWFAAQLAGAGMALPIWVNVWRDCVWTLVAMPDLNFTLKKTTDTGYGVWSQYCGQQIWSILSMLVSLVVAHMLCASQGRTFSWTRGMISLSAAGLAILSWDWALATGSQYYLDHYTDGTDSHLNTANAGYYAGLWCGFLEGPTQFAVTVFILMVIEPEVRAIYFNNPLVFLIEAIISVIPGFAPGCFWQIISNGIYQLRVGFTAKMITAAIAVPAGVGLLNGVVAQITVECTSRLPEYGACRLTSKYCTTEEIQLEDGLEEKLEDKLFIPEQFADIEAQFEAKLYSSPSRGSLKVSSSPKQIPNRSRSLPVQFRFGGVTRPAARAQLPKTYSHHPMAQPQRSGRYFHIRDYWAADI